MRRLSFGPGAGGGGGDGVKAEWLRLGFYALGFHSGAGIVRAHHVADVRFMSCESGKERAANRSIGATVRDLRVGMGFF